MNIGQRRPWEDSVLAPDELEVVRPLLAANRYIPNRFIAAPGRDVVSLFLRDAADALVVFAARIHDRIAGLGVIAGLPWESTILGKRMAAVRALIVDETLDSRDALADHLLDRAADWVGQQNISFLLCKVFTDDQTAIGALERNRFRLVETALSYVYNFHGVMPDSDASDDFTIRPAEASDLPALVEIARVAFRTHVGRFHSDPNLSIEEATGIYEEWIRSSCNGYADAVFVAECGRDLAGYSVWRDPSERELAAGIRLAHYSIGAVDPKFRNRGLFRALTAAGMRRYCGLADLIEGPTNQKNIPVQSAYHRLGWSLDDRQHTFHRWFGEAHNE